MSNLSDLKRVLESNDRSACQRAVRERAEKMRAVRCSSAPPAQTVEYKFKSSRSRSPEAASLFQAHERECTGLLI